METASDLSDVEDEDHVGDVKIMEDVTSTSEIGSEDADNLNSEGDFSQECDLELGGADSDASDNETPTVECFEWDGHDFEGRLSFAGVKLTDIGNESDIVLETMVDRFLILSNTPAGVIHSQIAMNGTLLPTNRLFVKRKSNRYYVNVLPDSQAMAIGIVLDVATQSDQPVDVYAPITAVVKEAWTDSLCVRYNTVPGARYGLKTLP